MNPELRDTFLQLVRLGIGHCTEPLCEPIDWDEVEVLATKQGLLGVVLDGIQRIADCADDADNADWAKTIPYKKKLEWLGQVMLEEERYAAYRKAISELAAFYNAHSFRMMLLKGYTCGRDWLKPEHRPYGDIDIWLFGRQKEADAAMKKWFKSSKGQEFKIDNSHHHHTVFNWMGFTVENHYDFINIHHHKSNAEYERILKELGNDDSHYVAVGGERIYLPYPNLHALFLLKHMVSHFASSKMTLRQVLDWAFFVEKHIKEIDWNWLLPIVEEFNMKDFFNCINAICVEDLGFDKENIPYFQFDVSIKKRVLKDVLEPEFSGETPQNVLRRIPFKYRRWKANEWKHRLCYNESMQSAFWSGVKNHLLKPSSI